ncbi:hypothetical protein DPMN_116576 [Dreissena polymorpha]|uniref:Alpha-macroglobulin-like TED domain-containing protein n=1 Tax=Dreissena polymorpha TaxID=45954 RepID=A0A9D4KP29_DREPO|nr:hypothetical protein DPMN_116576 [Dreissena polymorpha]
MTYQRFDWSFSAFGKSDPSGSTWLTAFVIKSFAQASPYIFIDPFTVRKAIDFTLDQYDEKIGFFKEPGRVIHSEMLVRIIVK